MIINGDFRIFVNTSHSVFLNNTKAQIPAHFCRERHDLDVCQHSEKNIDVW